MGKAPARQDDEVSNTIHGKGYITEGDPTVTFEGKPVACVGHTAKFEDTLEGAIEEGNACVVVNGKRIALVADSIEKDGTIAKGASTIQVDEGNPFVFIGPNVSIGQNVVFSSKPLPAYNRHFELRDAKTGKSITGVDYVIQSLSSGIIEGVLNDYGQTNHANADQEEEAKLYCYLQTEILIQ